MHDQITLNDSIKYKNYQDLLELMILRARILIPYCFPHSLKLYKKDSYFIKQTQVIELRLVILLIIRMQILNINVKLMNGLHWLFIYYYY